MLSGLLVMEGLAQAQEVPGPTPAPTTSPSSSPSPVPLPSLPPPPSAETLEPSRGDRRPDRDRQNGKKKAKRRHGRGKGRPVRIKPGCTPFTFTQTYITWGPALAYGEPVTVVYEASKCIKPMGTTVDLSVQGTATVYQSLLVEDAPIDARPFSVSGMWDRPTNPEGWPPAWWECGVKHARYTWDIADMYTFAVSARWGVWSLDVTTQGQEPGSVHWAHNGCS